MDTLRNIRKKAHPLVGLVASCFDYEQTRMLSGYESVALEQYLAANTTKDINEGIGEVLGRFSALPIHQHQGYGEVLWFIHRNTPSEKLSVQLRAQLLSQSYCRLPQGSQKQSEANEAFYGLLPQALEAGDLHLIAALSAATNFAPQHKHKAKTYHKTYRNTLFKAIDAGEYDLATHIADDLLAQPATVRYETLNIHQAYIDIPRLILKKCVHSPEQYIQNCKRAEKAAHHACQKIPALSPLRDEALGMYLTVIDRLLEAPNPLIAKDALRSAQVFIPEGHSRNNQLEALAMRYIKYAEEMGHIDEAHAANIRLFYRVGPQHSHRAAILKHHEVILSEALGRKDYLTAHESLNHLYYNSPEGSAAKDAARKGYWRLAAKVAGTPLARRIALNTLERFNKNEPQHQEALATLGENAPAKLEVQPEGSPGDRERAVKLSQWLAAQNLAPRSNKSFFKFLHGWRRFTQFFS